MHVGDRVYWSGRWGALVRGHTGGQVEGVACLCRRPCCYVLLKMGSGVKCSSLHLHVDTSVTMGRFMLTTMQRRGRPVTTRATRNPFPRKKMTMQTLIHGENWPGAQDAMASHVATRKLRFLQALDSRLSSVGGREATSIADPVK